MAPDLHGLGLHTLADVAELPAAAIGGRFGTDALRAWRALHGKEPPLRAVMEQENDLNRLRPILHHCTLNLLKKGPSQKSINVKRQQAGWDEEFFVNVLAE